VTPGAVVSWKDFTFHDGEQADKLLVVLNAGGKFPYLVVRTTSQQNRRETKEGCSAARGYYCLPANNIWPRKNTWILLNDPYELEATACLQAKFRGDARIIHELKEQTIKAIINCFLKTEDCSDDHRKFLGY